MAEERDKGVSGGKSRKGEFFRYLGTVSMIGINLVASTFVGFALGYWVLDRIFNTFPWFTLVFLILGIVSGFRHLFRVSQRMRDDDGV